MEHEIHSVQSRFWRDAYLFAMQAHHPDPAAAADEAFMAFDCRFGVQGEEWPDATALYPLPATSEPAVLEHQTAAPDAGLLSQPWGLSTLGLARKFDAEMLASLTADELVKQANETPSNVPSVTVSDPPIEGLPAGAEKSDDEALG